MNNNLHVHLPDWPARRLVCESLVSWGFRHLDDPYIDAAEAPWPLVRNTVLAFLRHRLTDYDDQLRARCERDEAYRDKLVGEIAQAAFLKYPWLSNDPRPFPQIEDCLFLDRAARELSNLHSLRDHLESAIRDLKRSCGSREQITGLEAEVARTKEQITEVYSFLTVPKTGEDSEGVYSRSILWPHEDEGDYYFFNSRSLPPNRLNYLGFQCPRCQASVAQRKGFVNWGQRHDRMIIWSCYCLTYSVYQPPRFRVALVTLLDWNQFVEKTRSTVSTAC
jgi:hypothetical protein